MTAPHTPPAALDVAAIEARAAAARPDLSRIVVVNGVPSIGIVDAAFITAALDDVPALLAHIAALRAQHAADVAAAVAGERERAVAVCRAVADGWERASVTAKVDTGLALIRAEGATECADALAAPTGGGE